MAGYNASPTELAELAKRIVDVDGETQGTLRNIRSTVDGLQGLWAGSAATAFNSLMGRFEDDAQKLQQALRAIAEQISGSSDVYTRQEEEAAQASQSIMNRL